jgi:hypothetical protein
MFKEMINKMIISFCNLIIGFIDIKYHHFLLVSSCLSHHLKLVK